MTMMYRLGKATESAILFVYASLRFLEFYTWKSLFEVKLKWDNQLQKYLRNCTVFCHTWPVHDLVLVIPPPPLIKVASNTRPYSKRGGTTLNGREEGGQYYILQTFDQERFEARRIVFPWECLIIFATGCSKKRQYDRATAEDVRLKAMEKLSETKKRGSSWSADESDYKTKRQRRSGGDAIEQSTNKAFLGLS